MIQKHILTWKHFLWKINMIAWTQIGMLTDHADIIRLNDYLPYQDHCDWQNHRHFIVSSGRGYLKVPKKCDSQNDWHIIVSSGRGYPKKPKTLISLKWCRKVLWRIVMLVFACGTIGRIFPEIGWVNKILINNNRKPSSSIQDLF